MKGDCYDNDQLCIYDQPGYVKQALMKRREHPVKSSVMLIRPTRLRERWSVETVVTSYVLPLPSTNNGCDDMIVVMLPVVYLRPTREREREN